MAGFYKKKNQKLRGIKSTVKVTRKYSKGMRIKKYQNIEMGRRKSTGFRVMKRLVSLSSPIRRCAVLNYHAFLNVCHYLQSICK
jgi:hypothetical protein